MTTAVVKDRRACNVLRIRWVRRIPHTCSPRQAYRLGTEILASKGIVNSGNSTSVFQFFPLIVCAGSSGIWGTLGESGEAHNLGWEDPDSLASYQRVVRHNILRL